MDVKKKKRMAFLIIFLVLLAVEFIIGIFFKGGFVRAYLGDVIVVVVIYAFIRVFIPDDFPFLTLAVFVFALLVELSQIIPLCDFLGIKNGFIRTLMGTSFSSWDILCYFAGCLTTVPYDIYLFKRKKSGK